MALVALLNVLFGEVFQKKVLINTSTEFDKVASAVYPNINITCFDSSQVENVRQELSTFWNERHLNPRQLMLSFF